MTNDVALLQLASSTTFAPVGLPADGSLETAGTTATVIGWGDTQANPRFPSELHHVDVPIVSDAQCGRAYGGDFVAGVQLCAGDYQNGGIDSCQGDSGGPMVVNNGGTYTQVGIVSWGNGCALARNPGVYSRVSALRSWVDGVVSGGGTPPPPPPPPPGSAKCLGEPATIIGTAGDDILIGTTGRDVIVGLNGDDEIRGRSGNDLICAGPGHDYVDGGRGNDQIAGGAGIDDLFGGPGRDLIRGGAGSDWIVGNAGDDQIFGGAGIDYLFGAGGNDRLVGGFGADLLLGGGGFDRAHGKSGTDTCDAEREKACEA